MAITATWSVNDMTHRDSDGGVIIVLWQCLAQNDSGPETASESGKLLLTPDPTDPSYIPYADLTESDVLNWVYDSLVQSDEETPEQAKARVQDERIAKVQAQIDRAATQSNGLPWAS